MRLIFNNFNLIYIMIYNSNKKSFSSVILLFITSILSKGFAFYFLYDLFIKQFTSVEINFSHSVGIIIFYSLFKGISIKRKKEKATNHELINKMIFNITIVIIYVIFGYLISLFM